MKLYTEEQMLKVWMAGQKYWKTSGASITFEELLEHEKPIELPSDEDLEKAQKEQRLTMEEMCRFEEGVEWVIKRINNQNK